MSLIEHLKIRTPLVWVNTAEPNRYCDVAMRFCSGDLYTMDPKEGFSIWDRDDKAWKPIIFEQMNPLTGQLVEYASHDLAEAIGYVLDNPGTMIIHFAHKVADDLCGILAWAFSDYRDAFFSDDKAKLGPQFLMFSYGVDIPPDLLHLLTVINPSLPSGAELSEIAAHIESEIGDQLENEIDLSKVSACGVGLTESNFIEACILSMRDRNTLDPLYVNEYKMEKIRSGGNLEIRRPALTLDHIGGMDLAKKLIRHVEWMWNNAEEAKSMQLQPLRRVMLVGVPGSGKSAICEAVATTLGLDLAKTGVSQNLNSFIGQSEANMRNTFAQIGALAPIVCWIDEFGRDLSIGNYQGDGGTTSRVHGEFLTGLQELPNNVFLMAAANHIDHIAPEMLRADRFDRILFVGFPTMLERVEIFKIHLGAAASNHNIEALAENSSMFTGAEIKALIIETRFKVSMDERRSIETQDILDEIPTAKNLMWLRHRNEVIKMYERAMSDWDWASTSQKSEADNILAGKVSLGVVNKGRSSFSGF